jgi:hypothetical protein
MVPGASDLPGEGLDVLSNVARCLAIAWISSLSACWLGISASFAAISSSFWRVERKRPHLPPLYMCLGANLPSPPNCAVTTGFIVPVAGILAFGKRTT